MFLRNISSKWASPLCLNFSSMVQPQWSLQVTESARKKLLEIRKRENVPYSLRVTVMPGGCHGFQVSFSLDDIRSKPFQKQPEQQQQQQQHEEEEDVRLLEVDSAPLVVVDRTSLELVNGAEIDYVSELIGSTFQLSKIPNAGSGCGCGVSFDLNPSSSSIKR